jgi:hypothetical protein
MKRQTQQKVPNIETLQYQKMFASSHKLSGLFEKF